MSVSSVVTEGFGPGASIPLVVLSGYGIGVYVPPEPEPEPEPEQPAVNPGGRITGGTFSRGAWHRLKEQLGRERRKKRVEEEATEAEVKRGKAVEVAQGVVERAERSKLQALAAEARQARADLERAIAGKITAALAHDQAKAQYQERLGEVAELLAREQAELARRFSEGALKQAGIEAVAQVMRQMPPPGMIAQPQPMSPMHAIIAAASKAAAQRARMAAEAEEAEAAAALLM